MAIIKDIYSLKYSEGFTSAGMQENQVDLILDESVDVGSSVSGKVSDSDGNPIQNVTIKLFDANGVPFMHTLTDDKGYYSFVGLKKGNYQISAVKSGYIITVPVAFYLQEEDAKSYAFTLTVDKNLALCSVAGHVFFFDSDNKKQMLSGATVYLIAPDGQQTVANTLSADDGEYLFYGVVAGSYLLRAVKQGYVAQGDIAVTATNNKIINIDLTLYVDFVQNVGTISGYVKHNNACVPNAFVGLYSVTGTEENRTETLVAVTKTNAQGLYMFGDVTSGTYKVKSKLTADT